MTHQYLLGVAFVAIALGLLYISQPVVALFPAGAAVYILASLLKLVK